jgi:hypothetical protein
MLRKGSVLSPLRRVGAIGVGCLHRLGWEWSDVPPNKMDIVRDGGHRDVPVAIPFAISGSVLSAKQMNSDS